MIRRHGSLLSALTSEQRWVLRRLTACRTAALGGHVETCDHCRHQRVAYNSCRNRHCPKCQASACARWMEERAAELLPVEYFHVVFTLPAVFNALALSNKRVVYGVLFKAVARTLLEVAANPKHLGARSASWPSCTLGGRICPCTRTCIASFPAAVCPPNGACWIGCRPGFFLPVRILSRVFRGKFISLLRRAWGKGRLRGVHDQAAFEALADSAVRHDWVVYAKPPFGGPAQVLKYLSRYTHRIAISNRRLVSMDDHSVTFRWKNYARGNQAGMMTLPAEEFLRRFLLHVVPRGFMRIRHFGLLANRCRSRHLEQCRKLLGQKADGHDDADEPPDAMDGEPHASQGDLCPVCQRGRMVIGHQLEPQSALQLFNAWWDSS